MPRLPRIKQDNGIFHVIMRSISDVNLFKTSDDKVEYLKIIKETQYIFKFKIYSYCLMSNHCHFIIDSCGADISKIMHRINFKYARYFNVKYNRHGHLFQDRFKSKLVSDEKYLYSLSLYIHRNPMDIKNYSKSPEKYRFSSLSVFLGIKADEFEILDDLFILSLLSDSLKKSREKYLEALLITSELKDKNIDMKQDKSLYMSGKVYINRNYSPISIINFVCNKFKVNKHLIFSKNVREFVHIRALIITMLRSLCDINIKSICSLLGNICASNVSRLSSVGVDLLMNNSIYSNLIDEYVTLNLKAI